MIDNVLAPRFCADTTLGPVKLTDYMGKWLVLFTYDRDFTPVCTTELIALSKLYNNFKENNCDILCISKDSLPTHIAWVNDIAKNTGVSIPFPVISDENKSICNLYNFNDLNSVYIIDPRQRIRSTITYPKNIGRNVSEILRTVCAMQTTDTTSGQTPANWVPGLEIIESNDNGYIELMDRLSSNAKYDYFSRGFGI